MKPTVKLASGNAYRILGDCKRVAAGAGWSLADWVAWEKRARDGTYEEFLAWVEQRFEVVKLAGYSEDPANWTTE